MSKRAPHRNRVRIEGRGFELTHSMTCALYDLYINGGEGGRGRVEHARTARALAWRGMIETADPVEPVPSEWNWQVKITARGVRTLFLLDQKGWRRSLVASQ